MRLDANEGLEKHTQVIFEAPSDVKKYPLFRGFFFRLEERLLGSPDDVFSGYLIPLEGAVRVNGDGEEDPNGAYELPAVATFKDVDVIRGGYLAMLRYQKSPNQTSESASSYLAFSNTVSIHYGNFTPVEFKPQTPTPPVQAAKDFFA